MKIRFISILITLLFLCACMPSIDTITPSVATPPPTEDIRLQSEQTRQFLAVQTIIAREQTTSTSTPTQLTNLPSQWTEVTTLNFPTPVPKITTLNITALYSQAGIYRGPGNNYQIACYVDQGAQLIVIGKMFNINWLNIKFNEGQSCYLLTTSGRIDTLPNPASQYWVMSTAFSSNSDLSTLPNVTPAIFAYPTLTATPPPTATFVRRYGGAFLWSDIPNSSLSGEVSSIVQSTKKGHFPYFEVLAVGLFIFSIYKLVATIIEIVKGEKNNLISVSLNPTHFEKDNFTDGDKLTED